MEQRNDGREGGLDLLKFIASVLIVFHHYQQVKNVMLPGINFFNGKFMFGWIVELFFIVSGFLIARYSKRIQEGMTFKAFFLKRYFRLFPLMALSVVVYELIRFVQLRVLTGSWMPTGDSLWGMTLTALGIQDGWASLNPAINNPLWYLSVLLLCYIVFYTLTFVASRKRVPSIYAYIFMVFLGIAIQTYSINLAFLNFDASRGYMSFFWGVLLYQALSDKRIGWKTYLVLVIVAVLIPLLIVRGGMFIESNINLVMTFIYYPTLILLVRSPWLNRLLSGRWVHFLGKISFSAYIWHLSCLFALETLDVFFRWNIPYGRYRTMFAFTAAVFLIASISYLLIEKPIDRRIRARMDGAVPSNGGSENL